MPSLDVLIKGKSPIACTLINNHFKTFLPFFALDMMFNYLLIGQLFIAYAHFFLTSLFPFHILEAC